MLSIYDEDLVKRDTSIPGLRCVLDVDQFVAALRAAFPELEVCHGKITHVRYRPGQYCRVGYEIQQPDSLRPVYATANCLERDSRRSHVHGASSVPDPTTCRDLPERLIEIRVFPNDRKLQGLSDLPDLTELRRLLSTLTGGERDVLRLKCLRYIPERRYVARADINDNARAIVKVYTKAHYVNAKKNGVVFSSRQSLHIPKQLAFFDTHRVVVSEWADGLELLTLLCEGQLEREVLNIVAAALSELHTQPTDGLRRVRKTHSNLLEIAEWIAWLRPDLAGRAQHLARWMAGQIEALPWTGHAIHGDFSASQVLVSETFVSFVDFDNAACGHPEDDLGRFIAHLERLAISGRMRGEHVEPATETLVNSYNEGAAVPLGALRLYTAANLFQLAPRPFKLREPMWAERLAAIIDKTEQYLTGRTPLLDD